MLHNTRAQTALSRSGPHTEALRDIMSDLIDMDQVRQRLGLMITALDIRYDIKGEHPLIGRRVPDADLNTADRDTRVHELLRAGRPVPLALNGNDVAAVPAWHDRVEIISAVSRAEHWPIPGFGAIPAPAAVLLRPDGYVAWATDEPTTAGLTEALTTWVGATESTDRSTVR